MASILYKTINHENPRRKPRVFFTCHPEDFDRYFERICKDIFKTHNCAIYYTEDMREPIPEQDLDTVLGSNNLLVIPVTTKLLTEPNRAMDKDLPYALRANMPILPIMMEPDLDKQYSQPDKFGTLQYLSPCITDETAIAYEEKLRKFLESVLIGDEMAQRIRAAFDAYIFLSYRKKDRRYANELMRLIHRNPQCRDIAIWYDEFLTPGESFQESIDKILHSSKLFTLLVTPNLLEEPDGNPNFVMAKEYPAAKASGIHILPAEMEPTDRATLSEKYQDIPQCVPTGDDAAFQTALTAAMQKIAITTNDTDPEHTFLIGLAYLEGIDVEIDRGRGMELITEAAEKGLPEAMKKLCQMYLSPSSGDGSSEKARYWAGKYWDYYRQACGEKHPDTLAAMHFAVTVLSEGQNNKVRALVQELVYELRREVLGEEHADTLESLILLARLTEDRKTAIEYYEKAYVGLREIYGDMHPEPISALETLARLYYEYYREYCGGGGFSGLALYEVVLRMKIDYWGLESDTTLHTMHIMAKYNGNEGQWERAQELYEAYYAIRSKVYGDNDRLSFHCLGELAELFDYMAEFQKALEVYGKLYLVRSKSLGEEALHPLDRLNDYARKFGEWEEYQLALEACETLYSVRCQFLGEGDPRLFETLESVAQAHAALGHHQQALETYEKMYRLWHERLGEEDYRMVQTLANMASTHAALGNHKEALELREKVASLQPLQNYVYLIPCGDRAYRSAIAAQPPEPGALPLIKEGAYPAQVFWHRLDMNGDIIWESQTCEDKESLIIMLDFIGACGYAVDRLWQYKDRENQDAAIDELFDICYTRMKEQHMAAIDDMFDDADDL